MRYMRGLSRLKTESRRVYLSYESTHLLASFGQGLENGRHRRETLKQNALISFSDSFELPRLVHQGSLVEFREELYLHLARVQPAYIA